MARGKRQDTAPRARGRARRSRYAWYRGIPWAGVVAIGAAVVAGVFVVQQLGLFGGAGRFVAGGGVGDHRTAGQPIAYASYPPTSGGHWPGAARWGLHTEPVPDETAVHNLEHGGVVASHNNIPAADLDRLRSLLQTYPRDRYGQVKLLIRPYDKIPPGTLVLTAWNWIDELTAYDEQRVRAFLDSHLNKCCEPVP